MNLFLSLRELVGRGSIESEMTKEMRVHLEMETEENIRRGMDPVEARRVAMIAFGGLEKNKEATRDERSTRWLDEIAADVQMGLRGMRKNPAFTFAVVVLLALGTGANTAIFSVVNQLMLNPLPFPDGDRMMQVRVTANKGEIELPTDRDFVDRVRARKGVFEDVLVTRYLFAMLGDTSRIPTPRQYEGAELQPGAMRFVGMRPLLGREIIPADTLAGAAPVLILSERLWKSEFRADRSVVGTRTLVNGTMHVVIGVAPHGFFVPFGADAAFTAMQGGTGNRSANTVLKLEPGATVADANRELAAAGPALPNGFGVPLDPVTAIPGGGNLRQASRNLVFLLFGAVGFVLLIACANVANLLLSRAWSRQREFAVRRALGAGRGRLMRQVFTESLLFALGGGAVGLIVALVFIKLLIAAHPRDLPIGTDIRVDGTVLAWTIAISTVTGLLFGIAPALFASGDRIGNVLKSVTGAATASAGARRLRGSLVVLEVALSVVLLAGTGLLLRTLVAMQRANLGMETPGLSALDMRLQGKPFTDSTVRRDVLASVATRVAAMPGVSAVSYALVPPPEFGRALDQIEIAGRPTVPTDTLTTTSFNYAAPGMFRVAGIQLLEGRTFIADPTLSASSKAAEVVINDRFARRYWPKGDAIGSKIRYSGRWMTIVGIVRSVDVPGEDDPGMKLQFYQSLPGAPSRAALLVRSSVPAALLDPQLRRAVKEVNGYVRFRSFTNTDAKLYDGRATHRFTLALLGVFAGLAVILAAIGLHAVIAYSVFQRRREIGIRVALGAAAPRIARLVLSQGLTLSAAGIVIGIVVAAAATRSLRGLLYGTTPGDPLTSAAVALILLVVSVAACGLPARRATKVDPVEMLRAE